MATIGTRGAEVIRIVRKGGPRLLAQRVARAASNRTGASELDFPLELNYIADSRALDLRVPANRPKRGTPLTVGWICSPPSPGSGGHTTLFRMVEAVEAAGHTCVLYLYDRYDGLPSKHESVIRKHWPGIRAEIRSVKHGLEPIDAYVASSWHTAHILASQSDVATRRLYFIQDYEPYFHPQGAEYALAEDTYKFGFRCVALGSFVSEILKQNLGVKTDVVEHRCDTSVYRLENLGPRNGVAFYAKPGIARRGYELGVLGLREFHRRMPDREIHVYGDPRATMPFPAVNHGTVSPAYLSALYNKCQTGLTMSFTNISLVPAEMLACGAVPVLCGVHIEDDLNSSFLRIAEANPSAIASALCESFDQRPHPRDVSSSVQGGDWRATQLACLNIIEDEVYGG